MSNAELFHRFMVEAFQSGDLRVVDEMMAPDMVEHQFGLAGRGAEAIANVKRAIANLKSWFPDLRITFENTVEGGDIVWCHMTVRGTNLGPILGRAATGKPIEITVIDITRFRDGKLVVHWGVPDRFAMLTQLGLLNSA